MFSSQLKTAFSAILLFGFPAAATASNEVMTWVAPYAISQSQAAATADFGLCDAKDGLIRVGLQFWTPNWDGTIKYADHEWHTPTDADVSWWTNWCSNNGIQCLLTIYNNNGSWNWDLARAAFANNRTTFVNALIAEMDRLGLDGIDIDLEGIGNLESDRSAFDQFIHALWLELDSRGKLLTINSFHYIWNAPNHNWWSDWLGEVDTIQSMGYDDLYEGGSDWHKYSFQQNAGVNAGYPGNSVLMGMPSWLGAWGTSSGRGISALAHVQEVRYDLPHDSTGIAIWDLQLSNWQDSDLWCEIAALKTADGGGGGGESDSTAPSPDPMTWVATPYLDTAWPGYIVATMTATTATDPGGGIKYYFDCVEAPQGGYWEGCEDSGWQSGTTFSDWYLIAGNSYHYRIKARDAHGNETGWSAEAAITVPGDNALPTASFTYSCTDLACGFTDTSTDSDGSIASWSWSFGDEGYSTEATPSHTYVSAGAYNVILTVMDNDNGSDSVSQSVTVTTASLTPAAPTNLTASVESSGKGKKRVVTGIELKWTDNASNEEVFVIERCEETGKGRSKACTFYEFATVGANNTRFSYAPGSGTFQYRVKARNADGDSAYSNTVKI